MRKVLFLAPLALLAGACTSFDVGTEGDVALEYEGILDGYVTADGIPEYDGTLLHAGLLGSAAREGELVSVDLWPLGGVGVGLFGVRLQILPLDIGLGTLFFAPSAPQPARGDGGDDGGGGE